MIWQQVLLWLDFDDNQKGAIGSSYYGNSNFTFIEKCFVKPTFHCHYAPEFIKMWSWVNQSLKMCVFQTHSILLKKLSNTVTGIRLKQKILFKDNSSRKIRFLETISWQNEVEKHNFWVIVLLRSSQVLRLLLIVSSEATLTSTIRVELNKAQRL